MPAGEQFETSQAIATRAPTRGNLPPKSPFLAWRLLRMDSRSRLRETSGALLIDTEGNFLFQRRDDIPTILYPDKIALFGGHREKGETFLECIVREVGEEIGFHVPERAFEHLGHFSNVHPDGSQGSCQV